LPADLGEADAPARFVAALDRRGIGVDVLVNNAGYTLDGHYLAYSWVDHQAYQARDGDRPGRADPPPAAGDAAARLRPSDERRLRGELDGGDPLQHAVRATT
jgi:hypothetical protein